jgi:predicted NBD/HSP70 family sugar kinase
MRRIDLKKAQVANHSALRDINRQIVLNHVRERGPISRAEIARTTAMQRSTVSDIIDALIIDGTIEEIGKGESTGGRCPQLLRLHAGWAAAIGIDISPTRTSVATADIAGHILDLAEFPTEPDFEKTISRVIDCSVEFARKSRDRIEGIGVSMPGLVDPERGTALYIPYFNWRNLNVAERISAATGLRVSIDNDANAAALAELWFGQPKVRDARDFIMVFVHEGLGAGIVFDRQVYRGAGGAAGEFGHMIIGRQAPTACSCGSFDCWEAFASGGAAVARYIQLTGGNDKLSRLSFRQLIDRAITGEVPAQKALTETARNLSIGISNLIVGLSPEMIVIGGPITRAWPLVAEVFHETVESSVRRGLPLASIVASTLGESTTLMGALSLVLSGKFTYEPGSLMLANAMV